MNYYMPGGQVEAGGAPLDWLRVEFSFCRGLGDFKPAPHSPELYGAINLRHRRTRWNSCEK